MNAPQQPQSDSRDEHIDQNSAVPTSSSPSLATRDPSPSSEGERPPLPPRPNTLSLLNDESASRATLQAGATTAVSRTEIDTHGNESVAGTGYSPLAFRDLTQGLKAKASLSHLASSRASETGDTASIRSSVQNGDVGDVDALFKDFVNSHPGEHLESTGLLHFPEFPADDLDDDEFLTEFEPVGEVDEDAGNEGMALKCITAKGLLESN